MAAAKFSRNVSIKSDRLAKTVLWWNPILNNILEFGDPPDVRKPVFEKQWYTLFLVLIHSYHRCEPNKFFFLGGGVFIVLHVRFSE
jgi:hypothetical protein